MNAAQFSPWTVDGWKAGAGGQEDLAGNVRWDGLRIPQVVAEAMEAVEVPVGSRPQGGWEIQQSFSEKDAMMQGLMHGVEGIRTSAEGVDGEALRALLADVHPEMVALHVDGYDTVGALRAVVAWAEGKVVRGASTWDAGRANELDAEALALHAEAWHAAMPAFHVWGVDAAKWQDRGMLHVDALGAMLSASKAGLKALVAAGWSLEDAAKHATLRLAFSTDVLSSVAMARAKPPGTSRASKSATSASASSLMLPRAIRAASTSTLRRSQYLSAMSRTHCWSPSSAAMAAT